MLFVDQACKLMQILYAQPNRKVKSELEALNYRSCQKIQLTEH